MTRRKYAVSKQQYVPKRNKIVDEGVYTKQELTEKIEKMEQKCAECDKKYTQLSAEERDILYGNYSRKLEWYKRLLKEMNGSEK